MDIFYLRWMGQIDKKKCICKNFYKNNKITKHLKINTNIYKKRYRYNKNKIKAYSCVDSCLQCKVRYTKTHTHTYKNKILTITKTKTYGFFFI